MTYRQQIGTSVPSSDLSRHSTYSPLMLRRFASARWATVLSRFLPLAVLGCSPQATPVASAASADDPDTSTVAQQAKALGLSPWHADYPFEAPLSPRVPGRWYDRSSRQALAQVVANLQGNCTQSAWQFARGFFEQAPPAAVDLLETAADKHYLAQGLATYLENLADAMARMGDPALAPVLLRLADHPNEAVATRAVSALMSCGTPATLEEAEKKLGRLSLRASVDWLHAVARRAPQQAESIYLRYLGAPRLEKAVLQAILEETAKLPPGPAVKIAERLADPRSTTPEYALAAASILHDAGDRRGTARLREFILGDNPALKALAIRAAAEKDLDLLLDDVLRLSVYEDAEVRLAVAQAIARLPGDNIDETLTTMGADVSSEVRRVTLRELAARGKRYHLDQLIERVKTGSGTNLSAALQDISASGDAQALAVIYERFKTTPVEEQRAYMQALAYSRVPSVFPYLSEIFLGEEQVLTSSGQTTMSNAALLMANIEGALPMILELWAKVPKQDYRRRAHLLKAVGNVAGFDATAAMRQQATQLFASVWRDRSEPPQARLFALHHHRRYLTIDDAMAIKDSLATEPEPMRWALNDFLFEFF